MVVFGFLISFAGVGGPRAVGLAGGMQLMLAVALAAGRLLAGVLARAGDVLLAATVGMAAGLLAWPRGAGGELRRTVAGC
jgi:uncharacterized membrane protein YccC